MSVSSYCAFLHKFIPSEAGRNGFDENKGNRPIAASWQNFLRLMGESTAWREKRLAPFGQEITAKGHFITEKRVRGKKETNYHNYEENSLPSPCFPRPNCIKGAHRVSHKGRIGAVLTAFFPRAAGYGGQPSKNRPRPGQGPSVQDFGFTGFQKPLCAASASPGATGHDKKGTNAGRTRPKGMFGDRFQRDRFPEGTRAAP
ncbi:hypothetical protein, partial [uncultured Bilophila sp.]|uniref:hypothetical protein n=1 Tax=uncultured Bilophila sp. TaxID=529385 RepID=UPI0026085C02